MSDKLLERAKKRASHLQFVSEQCELGKRGFDVDDCSPNDTAGLLRELIAEVERLREELTAANSEIGGLERLTEDLQADLYGNDGE